MKIEVFMFSTRRRHLNNFCIVNWSFPSPVKTLKGTKKKQQMNFFCIYNNVVISDIFRFISYKQHKSNFNKKKTKHLD